MTKTQDPDSTPAVLLDDVVKTFRAPGGDVTAVDHLSLVVRPGEVVAFLGPNGAGKTTTVDMMLGLSDPDAGTVRVHGATPRAAVARGAVSAVMQTGGLLKDFTVGETQRALLATERELSDARLQEERSRIARDLHDILCRVLMVTTFGRPGYLRRALAAGASGFVVKDTPARQLADAVRRVHGGLRVVDPALAADSLASGESPLTEREADVLREARDGGTVADIARVLALSEGTVRNHLSSAIGKTSARTRAEAVRIAVENGWLLGEQG